MSLVLLASLGKTFDEIAHFIGINEGLNNLYDSFSFHRKMGDVFDKLLETSGFDVGQRINYATAIFVQEDYPIRLAYQQTSAIVYNSDIINVNFKENSQSVVNLINTWVSERTNAKITTLFDSLPSQDTKAVIVGVLHFKAPWEFPFFDRHTKLKPFFVNGRRSNSDRVVQMMNNGGKFPYYKDTTLDLEILGLPYEGGKTVMYVILPNDSSAAKLDKLEKTLTSTNIEHLVNSTKSTEVVILFPKMRLESSMDLKEVLESLGVKSLFDPRMANLGLLSSAVKASPSSVQEKPIKSQQQITDRFVFPRFSEDVDCVKQSNRQCKGARGDAQLIAPLENLRKIQKDLNANTKSKFNPGVYANKVIHKVFIDITESGTEAAAATGISLNRSGGRVTFRVDVPFIFFIYHKDTKLITFWGSVKSPVPATFNSNSSKEV